MILKSKNTYLNLSKYRIVRLISDTQGGLYLLCIFSSFNDSHNEEEIRDSEIIKQFQKYNIKRQNQ